MNLKKLLPISTVLVIVVAAFIRYGHSAGVTADGTVYMQIARNLLLGKGLDWQALWFPPLYSILIASISFAAGIKSLITAATIVSAACGISLSFAVFFLPHYQTRNYG